MIPKKIHYCWFGHGPMPTLVTKCIESWKKYLPDYEIKEWNEDKFDLDSYPYVREAYDNHKLAFVADVVRLYALYHEGGIYMDTDVEVLKPLDDLLKFDAVSGFEAPTQLQTAFMACRQQYPLFKEFLDEDDGIHCIQDGKMDLTVNGTRMTEKCLRYGLKLNGKLHTVAGFTLLPTEYLCPKSYETGEINITDKTLVIHHFAGSWQAKSIRYKKRISWLIGPKATRIVQKFTRLFKNN